MPAEATNPNVELNKQVTSTITSPNRRQVVIWVVVCSVIASVLSALVTYHVVTNRQDNAANQQSIQPDPVANPVAVTPQNPSEDSGESTSQPSPAPLPALPAGWRYQKFETCGLNVPIPPGTVSNDLTMRWQNAPFEYRWVESFTKNTDSTGTQSLPINQRVFISGGYLLKILADAEGNVVGSGQNVGINGFKVNCSINENNLDLNGLLSLIKSNQALRTAASNGMMTFTTEVIGNTTVLGEPAYEILEAGEMSTPRTIFVKNGYLYDLSFRVPSTPDEVETLNIIKSNLQFI